MSAITVTGSADEGTMNLVDDKTPQLGGDLDMNAHSIGGNTEVQLDDAVATKHVQGTDTALGVQAEDLNMNTHKITGVVDPVADQDVATKKYVVDNTGTMSNLVEDAAPQLGGNLDMNGHNIGGSTEAQIDDAVAKTHTQGTDTALGAQAEDLDMNTHKITGVVDPVADQDAATKKYVTDNAGTMSDLVDDTTPELGGPLVVHEFDIKLDSLLSADGKYSGITCDGVLGGTLAFGDLVYLNTADQRWELADADAEATAGDVMLAIVLVAGADGETRLLLLQGFVREDDWAFTSYGQALFVSCTAGAMTQDVSGYTTGDIVRVVGHASSFADQIYFNPNGTWVEVP